MASSSRPLVTVHRGSRWLGGPVSFRRYDSPSLPPEVFDALLLAVPANIRYLEARLADLEARLGQTSANSSKPPSSDPPHAKPAPPRTPSGKRKGGQPGHPKRSRPYLPPDTVIELRATTCDRCAHPLAGDDPEPLRHQVVEI